VVIRSLASGGLAVIRWGSSGDQVAIVSCDVITTWQQLDSNLTAT
jgi:Holliday junction resolvase